MMSRTTWCSVGYIVVVELKRWNGRAVAVKGEQRRVMLVPSEICMADFGRLPSWWRIGILLLSLAV